MPTSELGELIEGRPTKEEIEAQIRADAVAASIDVEVGLAALQQFKVDKERAEANYEALRDELVVKLEDGPRYFIGDDGAKYYAVRNQNEPIEVDLDEILAAIDEGLLDEAILDEIAPRKVDKTAFRQAVAAGRISSELLLRVARIVRSRPYVRFHLFDAQ